MKIGRGFIAFGGIILLGGPLLPVAESHAFGGQWRPAPDYAAAQFRSPPRVANMPAFRPRVAPVAQRYQVPDRLPYRPPVRPQGRWAGYGSPYGMAETADRGQRYPWPGYQLAHQAPMMPPTGYPPVNMMPGWQPGPPLFARQFAWQPAGQPWVIPAAPRPQPPYPLMAPQMTGYHPSGPAYGAAAGGWRPMLPEWSNLGHPAMGRAPVYRAPQRPYFAPGGIATWRAVGAPVAHSAQPLRGPGSAYWRPVAAIGQAGWQGNPGFRPVAYGRAPQSVQRPAARTAHNSGSTRDRLPGWVTTYEGDASPSGCGWCDGS